MARNQKVLRFHVNTAQDADDSVIQRSPVGSSFQLNREEVAELTVYVALQKSKLIELQALDQFVRVHVQAMAERRGIVIDPEAKWTLQPAIGMLVRTE